MKTSYIPAGYHTATPYLIIANAARALDFYKQVFGAKELIRMPGPDGKIGHAEIQIGDSRLMLADEFPQCDALSPTTVGGSPVSVLLYFENADAILDKAVTAGAKVLRPMQNQFYGDRSGMFVDPFGHKWAVATHVEDVPPAELEKRAAAMFGKK